MGLLLLVHGYERTERSWIYSPTFDISALDRPTVEFNLIYEFADRDQGAVLQYSVDDGASWYVLGSFLGEDGGTGLGWYSHDDIDASPGEQVKDSYGWAEASALGPGQWMLARHRLEVIPIDQRSRVRFRFALSALDAQTSSEGIGIDNFWIGDRKKVVLIEEFSDELGRNSFTLHETVSNFLSGLDQSGSVTPYVIEGKDAVRITYYTTPEDATVAPSSRLYSVNPSEVNARQIYYGLPITPTVILEGDFKKNRQNTDYSAPPWPLNELNRSTLVRPLIDLSVTELTADAEGLLNVSVRAQLTEDGIEEALSGSYRLYIAVVERQVRLSDPNNEGQERMYRDVMRKMLPSAAGIELTLDATQPTSRSYIAEASWPLFSTYFEETDLSSLDLRLVAFIQGADKTIYQATLEQIDVQSVVELGLSGATEPPAACFTVFPNPADDILVVDFGSCEYVVAGWHMVDDTGRRLREGAQEMLFTSLRIDVSELPGGTYTLILRTVDGVHISRRIFVRN